MWQTSSMLLRRELRYVLIRKIETWWYLFWGGVFLFPVACVTDLKKNIFPMYSPGLKFSIKFLSRGYRQENLSGILKTESLDNTALELWLASPSWYMSHYTMLSKYGNCTRQLKIKKQAENRLFLEIKSGRILDILWASLTKKLFHSRLLDTSWLLPTRRYVPRWPPTISYQTRTRGIIFN